MGLFSKQIEARRLAPLCRQLATAYDAGIPILRTLEMARREAGDRRVRDVLGQMHDDIRQGATLGDAAKKQSTRLPPLLVQMLAAGEHGGRLDAMLHDLASYYEDRVVMRQKIMGMAVYPIIQLVVAWFLGTFALGLVGEVTAVFGSATGEVDLFGYFGDYLRFQAIALVVAVTAVLALAFVARTGALRWVWGWIATFVWPLAPVTRKFALARFCRGMSLLLGSGVNTTQAIQSSAAVASNPYIERDLLKAVEPVRQGATLAEAFRGSRYLSSNAREMIEVGEASGKLEVSLRKASDYHFNEASAAVQVMTKVGFVLLLLLVAGVIGYVIISFYMRLYGGLFNELGI